MAVPALLVLGLALPATARSAPDDATAGQPGGGVSTETSAGKASTNESAGSCSRGCMTRIVDKTLASMVAHDPSRLPLATTYVATENSHPAALTMMTLWRTTTKAGKPDLLAIDTTNGQAFFMLDIREKGSDAVLWGRVKVVRKKLTELELYVNRSRGDHGFTYDSTQVTSNFAQLMSPPANRKRATRSELRTLSRAAFDPSVDAEFPVDIADDCQFSEVGALVVDTGPDEDRSDAPLGCLWFPERPVDKNARDNLVIDEKLGIVVAGAVVPGTTYGYADVSAFIPDDMVAPQQAQEEWIEKEIAEGRTGILAPTPATGEVLQVLQYYNDQLHAEQLNVYLSGPGAKSVWAP